MTRLGASPLTVPIFPEWRERAARRWGGLSASTRVSCRARVLLNRGPCGLQPLNYKKKNDVFSVLDCMVVQLYLSEILCLPDIWLSIVSGGKRHQPKLTAGSPYPGRDTDWDVYCSPILGKKGGFTVDLVIERPLWMRACSVWGLGRRQRGVLFMHGFPLTRASWRLLDPQSGY